MGVILLISRSRARSIRVKVQQSVFLRTGCAASSPKLRLGVAPVTLRNRITTLSEALRVMAPGIDVPYLRRARARLKAQARPVRNKRLQIAQINDLIRLGLALMQRAEQATAEGEVCRAALYRDGLMILLLICRPIRRRNLAAMIVGRHLVRRDDVYLIAFEGAEMKNRRALEQPLDLALTGLIDRYLGHYRLQLLGASSSEHVWISSRGIAMSDWMIYGAIVTRTRAALGFAVPPHRFRDSVVTTLCEEMPHQIWLAPILLHHVDHRTAEMHYNQARDASSVRDWQQFVAKRRRSMRRAKERQVETG
jgi:integrase/recombinase XerD